MSIIHVCNSQLIEVLELFIHNHKSNCFHSQSQRASFAAPSASCVAKLVEVVKPLVQRDSRADAMMRDLQSDNDQVRVTVDVDQVS